MPKVKKLPKWAIQQAGGINKKAWALARRGKGQKMAKAKPRKAPRRRSTPRAVSGASHNNNSKPGWGRIFKIGRTVDVFSGPAQGSALIHGITPAAGEDALTRYSAGLSRGAYDPASAKGTYGGIGTGLLRDWLRSKMGIYKGLGQKKILSGVMAANPELLATSVVDPRLDLRTWNDVRAQHDRAYAPLSNVWEPSPGTAIGDRFIRSIVLDIGLKVGQKAAEKWLNPILPTGFNF